MAVMQVVELLIGPVDPFLGAPINFMRLCTVRLPYNVMMIVSVYTSPFVFFYFVTYICTYSFEPENAPVAMWPSEAAGNKKNAKRTTTTTTTRTATATTRRPTTTGNEDRSQVTESVTPNGQAGVFDPSFFNKDIQSSTKPTISKSFFLMMLPLFFFFFLNK
jgi:hypothetical protein